MTEMFVLPKNQTINAYNLISSQVKQNLPLNVGIIFDKYVNRFVTGYFNDQEWKEGSLSEIKRQIYLLKKERTEVLEKLQQIKDIKGKTMVTVRDGRRVQQKRLGEILNEIIEKLRECNVDEAIKELNDATRKIQNNGILDELKKCLLEISKTKLGLSLYVIDRGLYRNYYNRMKLIVNNLEKQKYIIKEEKLKLNWRLIINLGTASVYETSLLFHRNYSIPYIPGSAVKGVTRHWAIQKFAEEQMKLKNMEYENAIKAVEKALDNGNDLGLIIKSGNQEITFDDTIKIFGTQNQKGEAIFFDALPAIENNQNRDFIVLDVMNVHYKPYYEKGESPGDWHSPTPIFFIAVEKGTKFRFCVASKNQELAKKAMELLKEAVRKIGIGAKTSAGYGYFEV